MSEIKPKMVNGVAYCDENSCTLYDAQGVDFSRRKYTGTDVKCAAYYCARVAELEGELENVRRLERVGRKTLMDTAAVVDRVREINDECECRCEPFDEHQCQACQINDALDAASPDGGTAGEGDFD